MRKVQGRDDGYGGIGGLGYVELLFQVLTEREEKVSVAIASNESFGGWTKTFTDPRLCAAIVDRLIFGGNIIETGTDSYRLRRPTPAPQGPADQHPETDTEGYASATVVGMKRAARMTTPESVPAR
ncbi:hypothetical protein Franean1_2624 [Parafrankia sp. EAN1pec]|nr:hypothetical protein Franean1_2624 [Frankia sp. EAN1pec]